MLPTLLSVVVAFALSCQEPDSVEITRLQIEIKEQSTKIGKLSKEISRLKGELRDRKKEVKSVGDKAAQSDSIARQLGDARATLDRCKSDLEGANDQVATRDKTIEELQQKIKFASSRVTSEAKIELEAISIRVNAKREELAHLVSALKIAGDKQELATEFAAVSNADAEKLDDALLRVFASINSGITRIQYADRLQDVQFLYEKFVHDLPSDRKKPEPAISFSKAILYLQEAKHPMDHMASLYIR